MYISPVIIQQCNNNMRKYMFLTIFFNAINNRKYYYHWMGNWFKLNVCLHWKNAPERIILSKNINAILEDIFNDVV